MQSFKTVLCIATSLWLSHAAWADDEWFNQPRGFNAYLSSVADIQNKGRDDDKVMLQGRLTNYLGKDNYEFTDVKGDRIEVELDDDVDWSLVHRDQLITISGKLDKNMFTVKVEAKQYTIEPEAQSTYTPAAPGALNESSDVAIASRVYNTSPSSARTTLAPEPAPNNALAPTQTLRFAPSNSLNAPSDSLPQVIDSTILDLQQKIKK